MSQTCSCTKKHPISRHFSGVEGFFFLCFSSRTSCTLTFHREGTRSIENDHVLVRTNARWRVLGRICNFCFIIIIIIKIFYMQECTTFPDFFFFFTHNANWLKCCCKGLTHIRYLQPGSMFSASIAVQSLIFSDLSPVVSVFSDQTFGFSLLGGLRLRPMNLGNYLYRRVGSLGCLNVFALSRFFFFFY